MGVLQTVKEVAELVQKADNIDLMRKVVQLQTEMMEMQDQMIALRTENLALKESKRTRDSLKLVDNWYYVEVGDGSPHGPYCTVCFDEDDLLMQAARTNYGDGTVQTECHRCYGKQRIHVR